jgi:hypothetical protein
MFSGSGSIRSRTVRVGLNERERNDPDETGRLGHSTRRRVFPAPRDGRGAVRASRRCG